MKTTIQPRNYQKKAKKAIIDIDSFSEEAFPLDVLFVGGGVSGLIGAIKLALMARQAKEKDPTTAINLEIGVMDKSSGAGEHNLSGAVINPQVLYNVFGKDKKFPFKNEVTSDRFLFLQERKSWQIFSPFNWPPKKLYTVSICELIRFLSKEAEDLGVHLLYGYPAAHLLRKEGTIVGVQTQDKGLDRNGQPSSNHVSGVQVQASITVLAEGSRGHLTQSYLNEESITSPRSQTYALGVKEVWESSQIPSKVTHTIGWPLQTDEFGGSFLYPMGKNKLCVGFVAGLDSPYADLDVHACLQKIKQHPRFKPYFEKATFLGWGAKTLPEGGFYSIPSRLSGNGVMIVGDGAGFINMSNLKGIHYSMESGKLAALTAFEALQTNDFSHKVLQGYDKLLQKSFILKELYKVRDFRQGFHKGLWLGMFRAALSFVTRGKWPTLSHSLFQKEDALIEKVLPTSWPEPPVHHLKKSDAVYLSKNKTRDDIPCHLQTEENISEQVGRFYQALCPAGVYEWKKGKLVINAPNCIDCKATDILGPRWVPREGGSGPAYQEN